MSPEIVTSLLQTYGSLGAVLIVAGYALRTLHQQLTDVQDKRIADAQAATAKLLELVASQHAHQALLAKAIDGNADAIQSLRMLIEALVAERGFQRLPAVAPRRG